MSSVVKSPLGSKRVDGGGFKTFQVPDASDEDSSFDPKPDQTEAFGERLNKIRQAEEALERRKNLVNGRDRLTPGALERISILIGLTQLTRVVDFGGDLVFELKSLKTLELREVFVISSSVKQFEAAFEIRRQHLARAIKTITGLQFEEFIGDSSLEAKLAFVDELDEGIAVRLYDEYLILKSEVHEKYSIKNENDSKEIVEDLKK